MKTPVSHPRSVQRGIGMVAAIVVLVMLASLAAAITRLSWTQQINAADDLMSARALQAARAGTEWGMYQALHGSWKQGNCNGKSSTLTDVASVISGFKVTVTCSSKASAFNEGQLDDGSHTPVTVWVYKIEATACNGATANCTDATSSSGGMSYVERSAQSIITDTPSGMQ